VRLLKTAERRRRRRSACLFRHPRPNCSPVPEIRNAVQRMQLYTHRNARRSSRRAANSVLAAHWILCDIVLVVVGDYGLLNLTAYNSTTTPPRPKVTIEHRQEVILIKSLQ